MFGRLIAALVLTTSVCAQPASAQNYPSRPITFVVPFPAGNASDLAIRTIFEHLKKKTGASFIIENRPGALGIIGARSVARATPDGYTLVQSSASAHSVAEALTTDVGYDSVKDFTHLLIYSRSLTTVLVSKDSPFQTIGDLIKEVKAHPNKLNYAYANGSSWIIGAKFHSLVGLDARPVPYKAAQDAVLDLMGHRIDYMISDGTSATASVNGGQGRVLLILGDERFDGLPNVPSTKDAGLPSMPLTTWAGMAGPAGLPDEARQWLIKNLEAAFKDPELRDAIAKLSVNLAPPGIDAQKFVAEQLKLWTDAAREAGIKPQKAE